MSSINKNLINFSSILIILFPFSLVSGPLIPEIFLFFIVLSFIYLVIDNKKFYYFNNNFTKIFFLFFIIINFSAFLNFSLISIKSSIFYFRFGLFSLAIFFFLNEKKELTRLVFISLTILLLILFLDSSIQFFFEKNIFGFEKSLTGRVSSFFGDELVLGSFLSKIFLFYLCLFYSQKLVSNKYLILIIISIFFIIIFYAASRTALASYILSILLFLIISKDYKLIFKIILMIALVIVFLSQFKQANFNRLFHHTKYQIINEYNSFNYLSQRHMLHIKTAYNIFVNNKLIGAGPKSFRVLCDQNKYIPYNYIEKTNTIKSDQNGELHLYVKLVTDSPDGVKGSYELDQEHIFRIIQNYKETNQNYNEIFLKDVLIAFYQHEFSEYYFKAKLKYLDGSEKKINLANNNFRILISKKNFIKNKNLIKIKPLYFNGCNTHPHNFFIQIMSEIGLIGLIVYLSVGIYFFLGVLNYISNKKMFNNLFKYDVNLKVCLLFGSFLVFFFPFFPSGNFFNNWISMLIYLPMGFLLKLIYKQ